MKIIKEWHSEHSIKCQYNVDDNGIRNGEFRSWHKNGQLEVDCSYVDGKIIGTKKHWNNDGVLSKEIDFGFDGQIFVVKIYADEFAKEALDIMGVGGIEELTFKTITEKFKELLLLRDESLRLHSEKVAENAIPAFYEHDLAGDFNPPDRRENRTTFT